jgi:alpha-beta hydrolase superfamily lysophospholipase
MQIAGNDFLVDAGASETFFNHLLLKDKTIHIYRELFHEIFNETADESAVVLDDLHAWIEMHL